MTNELGRWLVDEAKALGFDDAALVRADAGTPGAERVLAAHAEGALAPLAWLTETVDTRADIARLCPDARSVLVVVQGYYTGDHREHDDSDGARISRYAWGGDYHMFLRKRLRKLRKRLLARVPDARVDPFCDVDAVLERSWAAASGLGFVGKSALFIHKRLGTWTFLGGLATDIDLDAPPPAPLSDLCGDCSLCLDACPTDAFLHPGVVDVARCVTTWTVERPGDPAGAEHVAGNGWAFGCDVCQDVCPWNHTAPRTEAARFFPRAGHVHVTGERVPEDISGTPLARVGRDALAASARVATKGGHRTPKD